MFNKSMAILALAMLAGIASAGSTIGSIGARTRPSNFQINSIMINPSGSPDEDLGLECMMIYGPANTSLTGYAVLVVEEESDHSGSADDRGGVKNIFPLDGCSTDANGIFMLRDLSNSNVLGAFHIADGLSGATNKSGGEWRVQFQTKVAASGSLPAYGGNTFENEGGNYFLVTGLSSAMKQKHDGTSDPFTLLDLNHNGTFDYYEASPPVGYFANKPFDSIVDFVYVEKGDPSAVGNVNTNYLTQFQSAGTPATSIGGVYAGTKIINARMTDSARPNTGGNPGPQPWTPDMFMRFSDSVGMIADTISGQAADTTHGSGGSTNIISESFSDTSLNVLGWGTNYTTEPWTGLATDTSLGGTLYFTASALGMFQVTDKNGTVWNF